MLDLATNTRNRGYDAKEISEDQKLLLIVTILEMKEKVITYYTITTIDRYKFLFENLKFCGIF